MFNRALSSTIRVLPSASFRTTTTTTTIPRPIFLSRVPLSLSHNPNCRAMSTASTLSTIPAPGKHRFIVYAPDKTDEGTLARRLEVREKHLEGARAGHANGVIRLGGMMTTPEAVTNPEAPKKMIGSVLIYEAESLEHTFF
ncbi:hypothetical protein D9619_001362 [Psilocybe cf. subviscida]|uniref:YCII-related domain-containing protein n=1 Tax=Psilocybe cf. subviscida TaxID=2480587 RepID=A0A8H5BFM4_9AGAR|nr:hypothetical protein D9619_001362 [Psilocybe cf. subviscida]